MTRSLVVAVVLFALLGATSSASEPELRRAHLYRPDLAGGPEQAPKRIVSLAPVLTESLFALGAGDHVVGVTRYCDRPAAAATRTRVGGYVDPQLETILSLKPDLVVAMPSFGQRQVLDHLRERGIPVFVAFADSIDEVRDLLRGLGEVTQRQPQASAAVRVLDEGLLGISSSVTKSTHRWRAVVVFQVEPLVVAGPGTFADEALTLAGGVPAAPRDGPAWPTWSLESLLAVAPDVLVAAEGKAAADRLRARLSVLPPAKRPLIVAAEEGPILMRPGPTLHEDVGVLARLLSKAPATTGIRP